MECVIVSSTSGNCTVEALKEIFSRNGLPDTIVSDNATSFVCYEFRSFCQENSIQHVTPAPYCPFSNGQAEVSVKTIKNILKKNVGGSLKVRLYNALLYYRSTPHSVTKIAPSVFLNNRKLITLKDRINPNYIGSAKGEGKNECKLIKSFNIGDNVLALNLRSGPKWYRGVVAGKLAVNIYEVYIDDLKIRWRRHTNQLKYLKSSNDADHLLDSFGDFYVATNTSNNNENPAGNSNNCDASSQHTQQCNVPDASVQGQNEATGSTRSADRTLPRRSDRTPKPVVRLDL